MNINATLLAQMIMFMLFVWFCMKFVWTPIMAALEQRKKQIADGLADAERAKHDLELAAKRSAEIMREAKEKAGEIISNGEKRAAKSLRPPKAGKDRRRSHYYWRQGRNQSGSIPRQRAIAYPGVGNCTGRCRKDSWA